MTDRQYRAWQVWLQLEWNEPNRTDYYLMQAAMEACRSRLKNPGQVKLADFRIKFEFRRKDTPSVLPSTNSGTPPSSNSKSFWLGMMTKPIEGLPDELKTARQLREEAQDYHRIEDGNGTRD